MSKPRKLSGADLIKIFRKFNFAVVDQKGSHAKLKRILSNGIKQILTVPLHKELDKGTLVSIYRQSLRYIPEAELRELFYSD